MGFLAELSSAGLINPGRENFSDGKTGMAITNCFALKKTGYFSTMNPKNIGATYLPRLDEKVTISTWAYDMKAFYGYRNFSMTDEKGKTLAYANSIWVYMDVKNARPVKVPEKIVEIYGLEPKLEMNKAERKIHVPDDIEEAGSIVVPRFFIDSNHHMNNEKYILIAKQLLPEELAVKEIRVEYRKEAKLGDEIFSYISRENERYTVLLADKDKKPYAVLAFLI